jgi:hypothetical protein
MNGDLSIRHDPDAWTFIPRVWPNEDSGQGAARWAKAAARTIEDRSPQTTREQRAWLRTTLQRFATTPSSGEAALYLYSREIGGPFLALQVLPIEATSDLRATTAELLRLEDAAGGLREPDAVRPHTAKGLGVGTRGSFTADDGEGGEQTSVVWVFQSNGTDVRISTVANDPENFAAVESEIDEFIDGITAVS